MNLNVPPPGVGHAAEITPAALRGAPPSSVATTIRPNATLAAMLDGSRQSDIRPAPVSWTVTLTSWLLLALDFVAIYAIHALAGQDHIFARIITWNYHPQAATTAAVLAALVMVGTAAMTAGLRRADVTWLRVWTGAGIASAIAVAAMVVALVVGIVMLVVGVIVAAATVVVVLFIGGAVGLGIAEGLAG